MEMIDEGWQGDTVFHYQNDQFQTVMVRADNEHNAYEAVIDCLPTVEQTGDIKGAYGVFDRFADLITHRNKGTYEGGSPDWIHVCNFVREWEDVFFDLWQRGALPDLPELQEGYQYTDSGNIVFSGHCEVMRDATEEEKSHFYNQCGISEEDR